MNKIINLLVFVSLFCSFSFSKPSLINENLRKKYAIGSAVATGTTLILAYAAYSYFKNKNDSFSLEQDINSFSNNLDAEKLHELEEQPEKKSNSFLKILPFVGVSSATTGGIIYWILRGYTPSGCLEDIKKQNKNIKLKILEKFSDGDRDIISDDIDPKTLIKDLVASGFRDERNCPRACAYIYLKNQIDLLNKIKIQCKELNKKKNLENFTAEDKEKFEKYLKDNSNLLNRIKTIMQAIKSYGNGEVGFEEQFKRYQKFEREKYSRKKDFMDWCLVCGSVICIGGITVVSLM